jgi:hypothetical protein
VIEGFPCVAQIGATVRIGAKVVLSGKQRDCLGARMGALGFDLARPATVGLGGAGFWIRSSPFY